MATKNCRFTKQSRLEFDDIKKYNPYVSAFILIKLFVVVTEIVQLQMSNFINYNKNNKSNIMATNKIIFSKCT